MAKYTITHSCGCTEEVRLFGALNGRYACIEKMEAHPCPACRARVSAKADAEAGLPALLGSPKQVAWASDVRSALAGAFSTARSMIERAATKDPAKAESYLKTLSLMEGETRASIWIDYRGMGAEEILRAAKKILEGA